MPLDKFKPTGPSKFAKPDANNANVNNVPLIGIVKDNIDPTRSGRIKVVLSTGTGAPDPNDSSSWISVRYLSPFFGHIGGTGGTGSEDYGNYKSNPTSYGMWTSPPDIGTKVLCIFVNGDPEYGFYLGGIPDAETLHMVPAIGATDKVTLNEGEAAGYGGSTRLPVTNLNSNNKDKSNSDTFLETARPVHSYTATIMNQQGVLRDPVRGPISSSASREPMSRVGFGVSTPGRPIYEGGYDDETVTENLDSSKNQQLKVVARRGGHSIVMDDGDITGRDQLIRLRTSLGHQILMSDDGQTLMILHSNGQSYVELGKEGTVDIYSTNSINCRTEGDFNIHADRDVNIHAMENVNIQGKNIHTNSEETTQSRAGTDYKINPLNNFMMQAGTGSAIVSGGEASMVAFGQSYITGARVNLNSGRPSLQTTPVPVITLNSQTDTLYDEVKGWAAAPGKLLSVTSRTPAHAPWANAGMGVDIKTSPNADDNLPVQPNKTLQQTNTAANDTAPTSPAEATVASVPPSNPVSKSIDVGTTKAVVAAAATTAATGPAKESVKSGAAIIQTSNTSPAPGLTGALKRAAGFIGPNSNTATNNNVSQPASTTGQNAVAVGTLAQSPSQLSTAGILKPGADRLVAGLASSGKTLLNTLPNTVMTGAYGATSIFNFASNVGTQTKSVINLMQKAQTGLTQAGIITGREAPTQVAGLINAVAQTGLNQTISVVREIAGAGRTLSQLPNSFANLPGNLLNNTIGRTVGQVQGIANQVTGLANRASNVLGAIGTGNAAAGLAQLTRGLGGITNAVKGLFGGGSSHQTLTNYTVSLTSLIDNSRGEAAAAFTAIKDGFPTLQANVPVILTDSAKKSAIDVAGKSSTTLNIQFGPTSTPLSNLVGLTDAINGTLGRVGNINRNVTGTVNQVEQLFNNVTNTVDNTIAGITGAFQRTDNITNRIFSPNQSSGVVNSYNNGIRVLTPGSNEYVGVINSFNGTLNSIRTGTTSAETLFSNQTSGIPTFAQNIVDPLTSLVNNANGLIYNLGNTLKTAENAVNNISSLAGGALSLSVGGLTSLQKSAQYIQLGGSGSKASWFASGVNNLPGGIKTIASVANNANIAPNNIPGLAGLSSLVSTAQNFAQNGLGSVTGVLNSTIGVANSINNVGNIISKVTGNNPISGIANQIGGVARKLGGLTSTIANKLPLGQVSNLLTSLSSAGAGGSNPIKMPSIGVNTVNRTSINNTINNTLKDPGIPRPKLLGEIKEENAKLSKKVADLDTALNKSSAELSLAIDARKVAESEYAVASNTLAQGDPKLRLAKEKYTNAYNKQSAALQKYSKDLQAWQDASEQQLNTKIQNINSANNVEDLFALQKIYEGR